jgi:RNA polymerase II subunit A small phosphatase-like protein
MVSASSVNKSILLGPMEFQGRKTLVLDLDETLVHSSFKKVRNADIKQAIDIDGYLQTIFVNVRPYAEEFII